MKRLSGMLLAFLFWATTNVAGATPNSRALQEENVRVVMFRFLMNPYPIGPTHKPEAEPRATVKIEVPPFKTYFFEWAGDKKPDDTLLKHFAGHKPLIKKVALAYTDSSSPEAQKFGFWVRDKETKELGVIYRISPIIWQSRNKVRLDAGYFCGGLMAANSTYTLTLRQGHWKVIAIKAGRVS